MDLIERPENVDRRHPWEVARARFFLRLVDRLKLTGTDSWLDVGAGDAWFAQQLRTILAPGARLACWDVHYPMDQPPDAAAGMGNIEFSAVRPEGAFGGILLLLSLIHI